MHKKNIELKYIRREREKSISCICGLETNTKNNRELMNNLFA